jgi:hypothetical protein
MSSMLRKLLQTAISVIIDGYHVLVLASVTKHFLVRVEYKFQC